MKVYIAGPMTGLPQFNFPAFDAAGEKLRNAGFRVVSPAELDDPVDRAAALASTDGSALSYGTGVKRTWGEFLARDVRLLADDGIDAVVVLPGWEKSRGARLETFVANALCNIQVVTMEDHGDMGISLWHVRPIDLVRAWAGKSDISFHTPVEEVA